VSKENSLYTAPPTQAFTRGTENKLEQFLAKMEKATSALPVVDPEELQLAADGTTKRGGFRYTSYGFRQVTQLICPGLSKMLVDLSGTIKRPNLDPKMYFPREAQYILNNALDLRGGLLSSYRIIRNEDSKLIEGLIGAKHRTLENLDSYRQMRDAVESLTTDVEFYSGLVIGRQLTLWYRNKTPVFTIDTPKERVTYFPGYYFSNGEATGNSVRGTFAVYSRHGICLRPFKQSNRVTHIGRDFNIRLNKMFTSVLSEEISADKLEQGCNDLLDTSLGYADLDKQERKRRDKKLIRDMGNVGIPKRIAESVLGEALYVGSNEGSSVPPVYELNAVFGTRTVYDLFAASLRAARMLPANLREKAEQSAYQIMTGKMEI